MSLSYSHGREFVEQSRLVLDSGDPEAFAKFLQRYWPASQLRELLSCGFDDAVPIALVGLSLIGTQADGEVIAPLLHDDDGVTAGFAEHALWAIWFRAGGSQAHAQLCQAVRLIHEDRLEEALGCLARALSISSDFAEAYHQLAMIEFLRGDYRQAITHCRATLILNPLHFGAMSGLGHSHAALAEYDQARVAYQKALELNPRLEGIRQAIRQLRETCARHASVNQFTNL